MTLASSDAQSVPLLQQLARGDPPHGDDVHPLSALAAAGRGSASVFGGPSSTQKAFDAGSVLLFVVGMAAANMMGCGNRAVQSCSACSQRAATSDPTNSLGPRPASDASVSDGRLGALCRRARPAEILVVDPHAMEGHGHPAGESDLRPSRSLAPSDPHRPCLHSRPPRRWTENNIRRLE